jgi:hypothetical protein
MSDKPPMLFGVYEPGDTAEMDKIIASLKALMRNNVAVVPVLMDSSQGVEIARISEAAERVLQPMFKKDILEPMLSYQFGGPVVSNKTTGSPYVRYDDNRMSHAGLPASEQPAAEPKPSA